MSIWEETQKEQKIKQTAPELLEVLERVMQTDGVKDDDKNKGEGTVYDDARAAIKKARDYKTIKWKD